MKGKSNPVAKHLRTFNKATVERDRKKDAKKGVSKYKKDIYKEEGDLAKARDNVGSDSCWDGYKATGTKKKGGKLVPDCKKESTEGKRVMQRFSSFDPIQEEYFSVQFYDEKGKADSSSKSFKDQASAKKYLAKANATSKVGSYKMHKVKGQMESVDEAMYRDSKSYSKMDMQKKTDKKNQANKLSQRKTVKGHKFANEDVEQVDEISQGLKNRYVQRAAMSAVSNAHSDGVSKTAGAKGKHKNKVLNRLRGINRATKESVEQVDEVVNQDRYMRSHGKAAKGQGRWSFTTMRTGTPKEKDIVTATGNMADAANIAKRHFKGKDIYVMESVEHLDELTQREKDMIADRKAKRDTKAGRKDKKTRLIPKTTTYVRPSKGEDDHIVMQLRRAQDSANFGNGSFGIRVSPVKDAATVNLKKPQIDKLLAVYDKLDKPDQKRKYRITLLKTLRSMQQKGK